MARLQEIEELARKKESLAARSEAQRLTLALELQRLETSTARPVHFLAHLKEFTPLLLPAAVLVGLWLTRRRFSFRKLATKAVLAWTLLRRARPVWDMLRSLAKRH